MDSTAIHSLAGDRGRRLLVGRHRTGTDHDVSVDRNTEWTTSGNWAAPGVAPTGGTSASRLNVHGAQTLFYTATQGNTTYNPNERGLVIGSGTTGGSMTITGGTFTSAGVTSDIIGTAHNATGTLTIDGGRYVGTNAGTAMGIGLGTARMSSFVITRGTATVATLNMNINTATIGLNGGVLEANGITRTGGTASLNLNGGTLRARQNNATFVTGLSNVTVQSGGGRIDTQGFNVTIGNALIAGTGGGGLVKLGSGTLSLTGSSTYTGNTTIEQGRIVLGSGDNRLITTGSVVLGAASTSGTLVLGDGTARNQTLGGLTATGLGGSVVGGAAAVSTLTLNISSGTNSFAGVLGGAASNENQLALTKTGSGILSLSP